MSGLRPTEQLLEAEEQKAARHQHLQAVQLIYIHNALLFSKPMFAMREFHQSVEVLSFPAELSQHKNLADVWTASKSYGQERSAMASHRHLPTAANSFHFLLFPSKDLKALMF